MTALSLPLTFATPERSWVRLQLRPITLRAANAFVARHHRHSLPVQGCICCLSVVDETGTTRGVAIIGRPVARHLADGLTAEVTRVATDGYAHACSRLYNAAWRVVRALGYTRLITYTLQRESGSSLLGAGWRIVGEVKGQTWDRPSRPRAARPIEDRYRWERRATNTPTTAA